MATTKRAPPERRRPGHRAGNAGRAWDNDSSEASIVPTKRLKASPRRRRRWVQLELPFVFN